MAVQSILDLPASRKSYYLAGPWRYVAFIFPILGLGMAYLMVQNVLTSERAVDRFTLVAVLTLAMVMLDIFLLVGVGMLRVRLVLSPEGVEYHNLGWSIVTSWDNVAGIGQVRYPRQGSVEALLLRAPAAQISWWFNSLLIVQPLLSAVALLRGRWVRQVNMGDYEQSIPIGYFGTSDSGELGNDLRRYAPQLFGQSSPARPQPVTPAAAVAPAQAGFWPAILIGVVVVQVVLVAGLTWIWSGGSKLQATWSQESGIEDIDLSSDGQVLAVTSGSAELKRLRLHVGTPLPTLNGVGANNGLALAPDGQSVAVALLDGNVAVLRTSDGALFHKLPGHTGEVKAVAISPNGQLLASGAEDGKVRLWRLPSGQLQQTLEVGQRIEPYRLQVGGSLITGVITHGVTALAFSPDGQVLASGADLIEGGLRLWRVDDGTLVRTISTGFIDDLAFSPDSQKVAVAGLVEVELWNINDGNLVRRFQEPNAYASSVAFSPDGQLLATGWSNGKIQVRQLADSSLSYTLRGHEADVTHLVFTPDGQTLISASKDDTIRLWHVGNEAAED